MSIPQTNVRRMSDRKQRRLRQAYCRRRASYLWGQKRMVTPVLLPFQFGDGKAVIAMRPIATRLSHYVICIDSRWDLNAWGREHCLREHLDLIYEYLEDWFGHCRCEECNEPEEDVVATADDPFDGWPRPCLQGGTECWPLENVK